MQNYSNINIVQNSNMQIDQYINYLAIDILEKIGNQCPSQAEIDLIESKISLGIKKYKNSVRVSPDKSIAKSINYKILKSKPSKLSSSAQAHNCNNTYATKERAL